MDYLNWNQKLWNYFFNPNFQNNGQKIVLAVTEEVINQLGEENGIENPVCDFIAAINCGPKLIDNNGNDAFSLNGNQLDFLTKAKWYIDNPNYYTGNPQARIQPSLIPRWNQEECFILAYLAYLVLMVGDNRDYWRTVNSELEPKTTGASQAYTTDLFEYLKQWAANKGFNFYYKNIFTVKKNVGTIYSQLPLTKAEEMQILASLYDAKRESPEEYSILKDSPDSDLIEEFMENQKPYLNTAIAKELNDNSSELREVIIDYVIQNFKKYIEKSNTTVESEISEIKELLANRRVAREQIKPEYHLCIKNNKVTGVLLVNIKIATSLKGNKLIFRSKNIEREHQTRFFENIAGDNGEHFKLYFLDTALEEGNYSIIIDEKKTGYGIKAFPVENLNYPIWYKDFSKHDANKFKLIETGGKIKFDINNPHKLIINPQHFNFNENDAKEGYKLKSLGKNFSVQIGNDVSQKEIFGLTPIGIKKDVEFGGKKIELINKNIEVKIQGSPDGQRNKTSFLSATPITVTFNPTPVSQFELLSANERIVIKSSSDFQDEINLTETLYSEKYDLEEGDYVVKIYDEHQNSILKEFSVTSTTSSNTDHRSENLLEYKVIDFEKIQPLTGTYKIYEEHEIAIDYRVLEGIIDVLIKGKKISNIYENEFKYLLEELVKKYHCNLFEDQNNQRQIDFRELAKKIIYILDSLNIIDREVHYIKAITKPYWVESSVNGRYNLVGALTLNEINELLEIDNIKIHCQKVHRYIHNVKITIELPRQFYFDGNELPNVNNWKYHSIITLFDFHLVEQNPHPFDFDKDVIQVPTHNYLIPIDHVEVLNWFTLKYEVITREQLIEFLSFHGYHLSKIKNIKSYNNRVVEHYFLFHTNEHGTKYSYYPYSQRDMALRLYLKKVEYFNFATSYVLGKEEYIETFKEKYLNNFQNDGLKENLNKLQQFQIGAHQANFNYAIKNYFVYDCKQAVFGINSSIALPKSIEKYLVSLSGLLPIHKTRTLSVPNKDINQVHQNTFKVEEVYFTFFFEIPEKIAFQISNFLIKSTVVDVPGRQANPYVSTEVNFAQ